MGWCSGWWGGGGGLGKWGGALCGIGVVRLLPLAPLLLPPLLLLLLCVCVFFLAQVVRTSVPGGCCCSFAVDVLVRVRARWC